MKTTVSNLMSIKEAKSAQVRLNKLLIHDYEINQDAPKLLRSFLLNEFNEVITQLYNQKLITNVVNNMNTNKRKTFSNRYEIAVFYVIKEERDTPIKILRALDSMLEQESGKQDKEYEVYYYIYRSIYGLIRIQVMFMGSYSGSEPSIYFIIDYKKTGELDLKELND